MKVRSISWLIILVLIAGGCSVEISQQPAASPTSQTSVFPPTAALPEVTNLPTAAASTQVPISWANLNLTGRLVYVSGVLENDNYVLRIQILDLAAGAITTIFQAPVNSWIYYLTVSPDDQQLIMSYTPPHEENPDIYQALYIMPLDGSRPPELLFKPPAKEDQYMQVEWSPDGRYIYYTHVNYQNQASPDQKNPVYEIDRMAYPGGQPEKVADQAYWPRLSSDSTHLVYVAVDPLSFRNRLMVSDADGSNAHEVSVAGTWDPDIKDAPIFAPDGQSIIFSAAAPAQSSGPNWLERIAGLRVAKADGSIPSEWWSIPIAGGALLRLTRIQSIGLFAGLSPDQQYLASASGNGIFVMKPDGSELTFLLPEEISSGTVSWIP